MKRSLLQTLLLHLGGLLVLSGPLAFLTGYEWNDLKFGYPPSAILRIYAEPGFWIIVSTVCVLVMLLLLVPLDLAQAKPPSAGKRRVAKVTAAVLAGLPFWSPWFFVFFYSDSNVQLGWVAAIICGGCWIACGIAFFRATRNDDAKAMVERTSLWLKRSGGIFCSVAMMAYSAAAIGRVCCYPQLIFLLGVIPGLIILLLARTPRGVFDWVRSREASRG